MTYWQRVAKIRSMEDLDNQIRLADNYLKKALATSKKIESLGEKILYKKTVLREAEAVLFELRIRYFDILNKIEGEK